MKIFINENDKYNAFRAALVTTAKYHKVEDYEFKSNFELYEELNLITSPLWSLLNDYFQAYNEWFEFYQERKVIEESENIGYDLNPQEKMELVELVNKRQDSFDSLKNKYNELSQ